METKTKTDRAAMTLTECVLESASYRAQQYVTTKAKFIAALDKDPQYTLEWSEQFFADTAEATMWAFVAATIRDGETTVVQVINALTEQVLNAYPNNSSSKVSNLAKDAQLYAKVRVLQELRHAERMYARTATK